MTQKARSTQPMADLIDAVTQWQHQAWDQYVNVAKNPLNWTKQTDAAAFDPLMVCNDVLDQFLKLQTDMLQSDRSLPKVYLDWLHQSESVVECMTEAQRQFGNACLQMLREQMNSEKAGAEDSTVDALKFWRDASDTAMAMQSQWWQAWRDSLAQARQPRATAVGRAKRRPREDAET